MISIIGDGAITGGMAYEAMNHAGFLDKNMIVILNDNQQVGFELMVWLWDWDGMGQKRAKWDQQGASVVAGLRFVPLVHCHTFIPMHPRGTGTACQSAGPG